MKAVWLFMFLMSSMTQAFAGELLASLDDPAGDVHISASTVGNGAEDFDLLGLRVSRDAKGFWFSATFKNAIRDPKDFVRSVSSESLGDFARKGFYQFNIDVYVDMDRIAGSGNTFTLPGRHAEVASGFAWERAVILTPRPELIRHQLQEVLHEQFPEYPGEEIAKAVDKAIIFPVRIKVHGKTVDFFVPKEFFSGSDGKNWAVTAFVTAATIDVPSDFSLAGSGKKALERMQLGVMQKVAYGASGIGGEVLDVLDGASQRNAAEPSHGLPGVSWGNDAEPAAVLKEASDTSGLSIAKLFQATASIPATLDTNPPPASAPASESIADRLRTLQKLLDQGLIDESEYKQQKARILNSL